MKIVKVNSSHFFALKEFMLKALKTDPEAFTVSYEEYFHASDYWWQNYLQNYLLGKDSIMLFGIDKNKNPVAMTGVLFGAKARQKHVATIVWVYVEPKSRGKGMSIKLLKKALQIIKNESHIEKVNLTVTSSQKKAISIYEKFGFYKCGQLSKELKINDTYYDFISMEKFTKEILPK